MSLSSQSKKVYYLLITLTALVLIPYIALYIARGDIPRDFFHFPATEPKPKPGPNNVVIFSTIILFVLFLLLLFFPKFFGFKKADEVGINIQNNKIKIPIWFWIGLISCLTVLIVFIIKTNRPKWLTDWALLPLWWGFILMLDGMVYKRNNGKSLVHNAPTELIAMAVFSISGWLIFEYFNFFIDLNWYYPYADEMPHDSFLLYAFVGSSAFIPMAFEWYQLLRTFPVINRRYKHGKKIKASTQVKILLLLIALAGLYFIAFKPNQLFYAVWLSPLIVLIIVLQLLGIWTPFKPIAERGDWTSLIAFAPVWLLQGLCVESWNYISFDHHPALPTYNPGYWEYCIPYVTIKGTFIFNMPALGYLGYVPYSLYCCIWFIVMSFIMGVSTNVSLDEKFR